jgi:hypothetical protein
VFTAYRALADQTQDARAWLAAAPPPRRARRRRAAQPLRPLEMWRRTRAVEISLRGHGMAVPACGSLANPGLAALREADGRLLFAHSDLSGYSVFEEAAWWGDRAGRKVLG